MHLSMETYISLKMYVLPWELNPWTWRC